MGRKHAPMVAVALVAVAISLWAGLGSASAQPQAAKLDKVTLQLKWVTQSQFAGYYAAKSLGYYKQFGLDVNIKVGGPSITPETVVASGQADIGVVEPTTCMPASRNRSRAAVAWSVKSASVPPLPSGTTTLDIQSSRM